MPSASTLEAHALLNQVEYEVIRDARDVALMKRWLTELGDPPDGIGVDTETTGLSPHRDRVRLIQLGAGPKALIVDLEGFRAEGQRQVDWTASGLRELREVLEGPQRKVLQNAAFDLNFLRGEGIVLGGPIFDTMIAAILVNNGQGVKNNLGALVQRNLQVLMPKELQRADWSKHITPEMYEYAAKDVVCLPPLAKVLSTALVGSKIKEGFRLWDLFVIEMKVLKPIALMQWHGFGFDREGAEALREELISEADELQLAFLESLDKAIRARVSDDAQWLPRNPDGTFNTREKETGSIRLGTKLYPGFNPRSTQQMTARFEQAGVILRPDENGKLSLDQNLLAFLRKDYPLIDQYMTWKSAVTRVSNIEKLLKSIGPDGRIHSSYRQMGTETGRLSAAEPNLQQVNRSAAFRSKFVAAPGCVLVVADFSQIELRVAAELSGEERMLEAYRAGRDLHTETAALMAGVSIEAVTKAQRQSAKVANFGLLYGAGPATLRKQAVAQYGIDMELDEAKEIVEGFRAAYPTLYKWQTREGNGTTKAVFTALGRRRFLFGFNDKYTTRINTQVQGTAGDIAKLAIGRLWQEICAAPEGEAKLIAMVHDEIVVEAKENAAERWARILKGCMEAAGSEICKTVPIVAEVSTGKTWAEAK